MAIPVTLHPISNRCHIHQVFAGFATLERRGILVLRQGPCRYEKALYLLASIDGIRVLYDVEDHDQIDEELYDEVTLYFKRSYDPEIHASREKVRPLGLNYELHVDAPSLSSLKRALHYDHRRRDRILRALGIPKLTGKPFTSWAETFWSPPNVDAEPHVLFMTRVWSPAEMVSSAIPQQVLEHLNEQRAGCVAALKNRFDKRFTGGLVPTDWAYERYPELVLDPPDLSARRNVMAFVAKHPIGVQTIGLHDSDGWKLGEYVAYGRAIVCERRRFYVPGFGQPENYLEFTTPEQCVEAVGTLMDDRDQRVAMMHANHRFFQEHGRHDALILRTLLETLATRN